MSKELKNKTKRNIQFFCGIFLFVVLHIVIVLLNKSDLTVLKGVCSAFQYACCLFLVYTNKKRGIIISIIMLSLSIINMLRVIVMTNISDPIAGVFNQFFYIVTIIWLGAIFAKQEKTAVTDMLTGLLNRRGLYKKLEELTENNKSFCIIDIELSNFKLLNDSFGNVYGDRLLKKMAERITSFVGENGVVSRKNGAAFVIILKNTQDAEADANKLLDIIREKIALSLEDDYIDCYVTAFAGMASFPYDSDNYETLIKYADMAMVEALHFNSTTVCRFKPEMEKRIKHQAELEHLINEGIEKDYFYLVYQPQYILDGKKLRGFETLIRMELPDGTIISPGEFIPIAEMSDQIIYIDDYVINRAMNEYKDIVINHKQDLVVSVNVSAKNIASDGFSKKIEKFLDETGFPAKNLEIEITEYCMVSSINTTIKNIKALRSIGVQFALDDFGTGYTSLNYLSQLPVNLLKIDKSLIDDIENDDQRSEFVSAIISMGHLMGCEVISEGVENEQQLKKLGENHCDFIQGYVWGKPLDYKIAKAFTLTK